MLNLKAVVCLMLVQMHAGWRGVRAFGQHRLLHRCVSVVEQYVITYLTQGGVLSEQNNRQVRQNCKALLAVAQQRSANAGYAYSFPFLKPASLVCTNDNHVSPLYKHVFAVAAPTLAFIGLPWKALRNVQFELQARPRCRMRCA